MAWNSPVTWVNDTIPSATDLNAQVRDNLLYLKGDAGPISLEDAIELPEMATPATPASGYARIYPKSDGLFYSLDDAGAEARLSRRVALVKAYHNAAQSIANNSATVLAFNSERFDTATMHDTVTNNTRLTAPVAGYYLISATIRFESNASGYRQVVFRVNNTTNIAVDQRAPVSGAQTDICLTTLYQLAVGDYVECRVFQNSGGALNIESTGNISPEFSMQLVDHT